MGRSFTFESSSVQTSIPLPCPPTELHDAFDWLWNDEKIKAGEEPSMPPLPPLRGGKLEKDIIFEVEKVPCLRDRMAGKDAEFNTGGEFPSEYGPGWRQKQERFFRRQRALNRPPRGRRENRTDK